MIKRVFLAGLILIMFAGMAFATEPTGTGIIAPGTNCNAVPVGQFCYKSDGTVYWNNGSSTVLVCTNGAVCSTYQAAGTLKLTTGSEPTCDATVRGTFWYIAGASGVKDTVEVCTKDAANSYTWRIVY